MSVDISTSPDPIKVIFDEVDGAHLTQLMRELSGRCKGSASRSTSSSGAAHGIDHGMP